ncbi:MAG TPA: lysylphosphatidylglycerol synthase transmembrane domain-containing protein [Gemmatimonadales bacterium]|nr:lysylphosphatidylglycerol synthase transmembrane domain-containing protein [Gemmatimonadales bacterium]
MANPLSPKLLLRGFEIFVGISLVGYVAVLFYGDNLPAFLHGLTQLHWGWVLVGVALASMDWIGGGLRIWVVARELHPNPPLKGMLLAGGMSAWAAYLTPLQSGAAPMMVYTMRRYGVTVPVGMTTALVTFVATIVFFGITGPLAILLGAGQSLGSKGDLLGLSLYDLFLGTLGVFATLGILLLVVIVFPQVASKAIHALATWAGRRSRRIEAKLEKLLVGIDEAHAAVAKFNTPRGWLSLFWATLLSGPSHANKLLAGYVALRVIGIEAHFVDVLLVQTLITFLLYFAPTPGASGIAEVLSAIVMTAYVPAALTPLYTLVWRTILSYFTIAFGALVFSNWVRQGIKGLEELDDASAPAPAGPGHPG